MSKLNKSKVVTGVSTRLSYAHLFEPVSINGGPEKYSVSVLIPKDDVKTIQAIEKAIDNALEKGIAKFRYVMEMLSVMTKHIKGTISLMLIARIHHK